ncbi:MAG: hypothetical protein KC944_06895 [Candidatus Omnitrophica bacterium]|nr:hypothetical protein [Candidatus Omnitrophota bacterium]
MPSCWGETRVGVIPAEELNPSGLSVLSLLEVELSSHSEVDLLERGEVKSILEEQSIQIGMGMRSGESWRSLGALLKADLLILIDSNNHDEGEIFHAVAIRTSDGIRIGEKSILCENDDVETCAAKLVPFAEEALDRGVKEESRLVAVSPFQCNDLLFTYNFLQEVYAGVVAKILDNQKDILIVEIEEAQSLADELSLTGERSIESRPLPYFVRGSFSNNGSGDSRDVTIDVSLSLGEKTIDSASAQGLPSESVTSFLEKVATRFCQIISESGDTIFDATRDAQELFESGDNFRRLGDWETALSHYEAGLLVKPELIKYRKPAYDCCRRLVKRYLEDLSREADPTRPSIGLGYALRSLDHLEQYLEVVTPEDANEIFVELGNDMENVLWRFTLSYRPGAPPREMHELLTDYVSRRQEIFVTYLEKTHRDGKMTKLAEQLLLDNLYEFEETRIRLPAQETGWQQCRLRALEVMGHYPSAIYPLYRAIIWVDAKEEKTIYDHEFLEAVRSSSSEAIQFVWRAVRAARTSPLKEGLIDEVENLRTEYLEMIGAKSGSKWSDPFTRVLDRKIQSIRKAVEEQSGSQDTSGKSQPTPNEDGPTNFSAKIFHFNKEPPEATFTPILRAIPLPSDIAEFDYMEDLIVDWVQVDAGHDLIASPHFLYILDQEGELFEIDRLEKGETYQQLIEEGNKVWILIKSKVSRVLVFDPTTYEMDLFDEEDGLPAVASDLMGCALGEDGIIVSGYFGRTWVAKLTVSSTGENKVEMLYEAKNVQGPYSDPNTAFKPVSIRKLEMREEDGDGWIAIRRSIPEAQGVGIFKSSPDCLLVNTDSKEVKLGQPPNPRSIGSIHGEFEDSPESDGRTIGSTRESLSELKRRHQNFSVQTNYEGRIFAFGSDGVWWLKPEGDNVFAIKLEGDIPLPKKFDMYGKIYHSNYYGLVYRTGNLLFQVALNPKDDH